MNLRHRLFCAFFDAMGWLKIQDMSVESLPKHRRPFTPLWAARIIQGAAPAGVRIHDESIEGPTGQPLRLRFYTPELDPRHVGAVGAGPRARPLVLNMHGGGWVLGNVEMTEWMCGQIAAGCDAVVVSVDYRLAPEHPAPAAFDDCRHAVEHLLAEADHRGLDRHRWAAFGDSAGGNLTALLALHHRDARRRARAAGDDAAYEACGDLRVNGLIYPVTDLTFGFPSHQRNRDAPVLTAAAMHAFRAHYLGPGSPGPDDPAVSPHFAQDLSGLPPAVVTIAGRDPLCDEGTAYAARLSAAGVTVRVDHHPDVPHGFTTMRGTSAAARPAGDEIVSFFRTYLLPDGHEAQPDHRGS